MNMAEQLEQKTVAMVQYVAKDEDGDTVKSSPDAPGAYLVPYCTGVWVSKVVFITAAHCVEGLNKPVEQQILERIVPQSDWEGIGIKKWDPVGQPLTYAARVDIQDTETRTIRGTHPGRVLSYDKSHDLALVLATPNTTDAIPTHGVASVATSARVGQEVHIIGHTIGLWYSYTHGWVAQIRPNALNACEEPVNALQISAPVFYGNSGGGAFNEDGELVGVMSWIRKGGPNLGFFIKYDEVNRFLQHARITR